MIEIRKVFHENGNIRAQGGWVGSRPEGIHQVWHSNGSLAIETPFKNGKIDGIVRQWDEQGKLIAESRLDNGTGILKTVDSKQGVEHEMTFVDGKFTGRQRGFCSGEVIVTVYWIRNKKVSKTVYFEMSKTDPSLPQYESDRNLPNEKRRRERKGDAERKRG